MQQIKEYAPHVYKPATKKSATALRDFSILFVENDLNILNRAAHVLTPVCRELYTARDGGNALELLRKKRPDLVLAAMSLPGLSGPELVRQIKQIRSSVPIILIVDGNDPNKLLQAIELDVDGYLAKPFNIDKLLSLIKRQASILTSRLIAEHEPRLLSGVNMAIQYLLSVDANQDAVDFALQEMAKAAQADNVSLFRYESILGEREAFLVSGFAGGDMIRRFLDGADTGPPEIPYVERWYNTLAQGKTLTGPRSSFPPPERRVLDAMRARSLLLTPIFAEGRLWGFACLSDTRRERHWTDSETSMIMTAARGLGSFMGRLKLEEEQREARNALLLSNIQWRETFDTIPDLVMVLDCDYRILRINKMARQRLDIDDSRGNELLGHCYQHVHGLNHPPDNCPFTSLLADRQSHEIEVYLPCLNGYFHITVNPTFDAEGNLAGAVHMAHDITNRRAMEDQLRYLSNHDELTKLNNRTYFEAEVERLKNGSIAPLSVLIADLDGLKEINDRFGHDHGDALIQSAADMLREIFRTDDTIARIGGDEFAILLKGVGEELLGAIMERARRMLLDGAHRSCHGHTVRFSMGCATTHHPSELEKTIREADMAMYIDKSKRKKGSRPT